MMVTNNLGRELEKELSNHPALSGLAPDLKNKFIFDVVKVAWWAWDAESISFAIQDRCTVVGFLPVNSIDNDVQTVVPGIKIGFIPNCLVKYQYQD